MMVTAEVQALLDAEFKKGKAFGQVDAAMRLNKVVRDLLAAGDSFAARRADAGAPSPTAPAICPHCKRPM